jgi:hypothetical protein
LQAAAALDGPAKSTSSMPDRIAELGVPLVLHPEFRSATRFATRTAREDAGLSWTYQTSLTALRLIDEGRARRGSRPRRRTSAPRRGTALRALVSFSAGDDRQD